ncbi:GNAT family N-acetyltransferase [Clostridium botulinum]|uniref:GNAT family N-acetyltransferase n=1 Tax=Clostridium botulinum TaxID=1491 RepID=UPI000AC96FF1|nr:GNAT family N-acetyltransferase [Clostridium botulinum]
MKNFPTMGEWMLGLMFIDPEERENGLGKIVHKELVAWAKDLGAKTHVVNVIRLKL